MFDDGKEVVDEHLTASCTKVNIKEFKVHKDGRKFQNKIALIKFESLQPLAEFLTNVP